MTRRKIDFKNYGIFVVFLALVVVLMLLSPNAFAKPRNLINVVKQASINGVLACGMMFVIIAGGIDLSAGSVVALSGVIAAYLAQLKGVPIIVPVLGALGSGAAIGFINGFGVAYAGLPPFIITLATMSIVRGAALILSGGSPVFGLQDQFEGIAGISIANAVPILVIYFLMIAVLSGFILNKTVFGRHVYAIGGNSITAKVSGINVKSMLLQVYVICGAFSGIAGLLVASRTMQGSPTVGAGYEMDAIAAVVIGGVSMSGGSGKWHGTIIGALLLALISNGLDILGVSSNFQQIIKGIIIAVAVYLDLKGKKTSA